MHELLHGLHHQHLLLLLWQCLEVGHELVLHLLHLLHLFGVRGLPGCPSQLRVQHLHRLLLHGLNILRGAGQARGVASVLAGSRGRGLACVQGLRGMRRGLDVAAMAARGMAAPVDRGGRETPRLALLLVRLDLGVNVGADRRGCVLAVVHPPHPELFQVGEEPSIVQVDVLLAQLDDPWVASREPDLIGGEVPHNGLRLIHNHQCHKHEGHEVVSDQEERHD
mmetsp:Transcript_77408/g.136525  ORF Transcript_77408/g.136525 Transcript_77408/m.136525 type:complete len:223 (+) Transcript_77408:492-1160(+)